MNKFPNDIMIEVTNECNLRCITCYSHQDDRVKKYMSFDIFKKVINEIPEKNSKTISLYNYWEPLLHKQIWEFVKYSKDKWIKNVKIATNWTFLDTSKSIELIRSWLDYISISVDWTTQNIYEKFRVWWKLSQVVNNIHMLVKLKKKFWFWPVIEVQFIIMSHNEKQIEQIKSLAEKLWVNVIRYKTVCIKEKKWSYLNPTSIDYSRYSKRIKTNTCLKPTTWIVVNVDWKVLPCCYITDKYIDTHVLWNINESNLVDLYNSEKSQNFIKNVKNNKQNVIYCKDCEEWNLNLDYKVINFKW